MNGSRPWGIVAIGFALELVVLLAVGVISYRNTTQMIEQSDLVHHTRQVHLSVQELLGFLVDAETGARGYMITGAEDFLEPYDAALRQLDGKFKELRQLTAGNPRQQLRLDSLEPLIAARMELYKERIKLRQVKGFEAARKEVLLRIGKQMMDKIRSIVEQMEKEENEMLETRVAAVRAGARSSTISVFVGTGISMVFLVVIFLFLSSEMAQRLRVEVEVRDARNVLEQRVVERTAQLAQTNEALRNSEKWLSTTLGSIGDAVIATDQGGAVTFINPVAQSLTGWTQEEARGKPLVLVFNAVSQATGQPVENPVEKVFRAGKVVGLADHTVLISRDRRKIDIEDSAAPIVTSEGERIGVVLVFRNVTESKRIQEERDRFFNLSLDMICIAGFDGYFKQLNPAWEKMLGFTVEELMARPYLDFIHPDDHERTAAEAQRQASGKNAISFENRYLCKDGSYKWLLWNATPLPARQLIFAVAHDITERKHLEETLRESEQRLTLASTSGEVGVWDLNLTTDQAWRSVQHDRIFGYESLLPSWSYEVFAGHVVPEDRELVKQRFEEAFQTGRLELECRIIRVDQVARWISAKGEAFRNEQGQPIRMMGVVTDITERKRVEEQIRQLNAELEERAGALEAANKELEAFTYSVSHDLRSPLRHVDGFSKILLEEFKPQLDPTAQRYLERIRTGTQQMGHLVDDLLSLARVGRRELVLQVSGLSSIVQEVLSDLKPETENRQIEWQCGNLPFVECDPALIKQVFANLLANAVKFTRIRERAVIQVGISAQNGRSAVFVRDNGVGFNMKYADKLFGVFQRLHRAEDFEGTGVGLATVQRIIHKHGGQVWAEGELDKGATFYFSLGSQESIPSKSSTDSGR